MAASTADEPSLNSCHIVSSRFLTDQFGANRLLDDMTNTTNCGSTLSDPIPASFRRSVKPDSIWFSHGLWGLPSDGAAPPKNMSCEERFEPHIRALETWKKTIPHITWQTLFSIRDNPQITNLYIACHQCQVQIAAQHAVPIYDLYELVKPQLSATVPSDYHLQNETILIQQYLHQ